MSHLIDIAGQRFGRLVALRTDGFLGKKVAWLCQCDCGELRRVQSHPLRHGLVQSCGCAKGQAIREKVKTHGMTETPEYQAWRQMKVRTDPRFATPAQTRAYIDRGITVAPEWLHSFERFFADVGPRPSPKHSLDRINGDGNYAPGNVRWATPEEQGSNRRNNHLITFQGKTMTAAQWGREVGIRPLLILNRLERGWSIERALGPLCKQWDRRRRAS